MEERKKNLAAERLARCAYSILLIDEITGERVAVEALKDYEGKPWICGDGGLLNWFLAQLHECRGLTDDSLPDGRRVYLNEKNAETK